MRTTGWFDGQDGKEGRMRMIKGVMQCVHTQLAPYDYIDITLLGMGRLVRVEQHDGQQDETVFQMWNGWR